MGSKRHDNGVIIMNSGLLSKLLGQNKEELEINKALRNNVLFESLSNKESSIIEKIIHVRIRPRHCEGGDELF